MDTLQHTRQHIVTHCKSTAPPRRARPCSVPQCITMCCRVSPRVAVCCIVSQCVAVHRSALQYVGVCVAVCYSVVQCVEVCCSVLHCVAKRLHLLDTLTLGVMPVCNC